ncbi:MAG: DNA translocase FtsK 4TM domain-containing protein, partial [Daejeonella sp.]
MSLRGNQFRNENSFREEPKSKATGKPRLPRETAEVMPTFKLNDDRMIKIIGLFFLIVSLYFMVAFTSYLFTWKDDQSYVMDANGGWSNLWKTQAELTQMGLSQPLVENWLGKFGALLSHQFIYEWFGVASFIFIGVFFIVGYRMLFKIRVFSISKTLSYSFFLLIFISLTLAFFHAFISDYPHYLEGEFGFWTNRLLQAQIGDAGIAGLLAFAGLTVLIIAYNIDFKIPERNKESKFNVPDTSAGVELEDEIRYESVEFDLPGRPNSERRSANKTNQNLPSVRPGQAEPEHVNVVLSPSRNVPLETEDTVINEIKGSPLLVIETTEEDRKSTELVEQFG